MSNNLIVKTLEPPPKTYNINYEVFMENGYIYQGKIEVKEGKEVMAIFNKIAKRLEFKKAK